MAVINKNVNQVSTILNEVMSQGFGQKAIAKIDITDLSQVFNYLDSKSINKTVFFDTLYGVFSDQIFARRAYERANAPIWRDNKEFGILLLKTYMSPITAEDNEIYSDDIVDGLEVGQFKVNLADIKSALIDKKQSWQISLTTANQQLKDAFSSEETLAAFLEQQYVELENSMEDEMEKMENMLVAKYVAIKAAKQTSVGGVQFINVLKVYNTEMGTTLKASQAFKDFDFLQYAHTKLMTYASLMEKRQSIFNVENFVRFTPKENTVMMLHNEYINGITNVLRANTYNDTIRQYPKFTPVPYWQGVGTDGAFASTSRIAVTDTVNAVDVDYTGVYAVVYDEYALAMTLKERNNESEYSKRYALTHTWARATAQYYLDPSENGFVLYIADEA